jgi:hypothetical protein
VKIGWGGPPHFDYDGEVVRIAGLEVMADCGSGYEPNDGPCYWDDAPGELSCLRHIAERVADSRQRPVLMDGGDP